MYEDIYLNMIQNKSRGKLIFYYFIFQFNIH